MAYPLTGRVLRPQKRAAPAYEILSRMAGILHKCGEKPYLPTDLTFVSIDMALYKSFSMILSILLHANFSIYLSYFVQPIRSIFIAVNWIFAVKASSVLTRDVA